MGHHSLIAPHKCPQVLSMNQLEQSNRRAKSWKANHTVMKIPLKKTGFLLSASKSKEGHKPHPGFQRGFIDVKPTGMYRKVPGLLWPASP